MTLRWAIRRPVQRAALLTWVAAAVLGGCTAPLPTYPEMHADAALRVIVDRMEVVRTLSARCDVAMTDARGESIRLDGAIAAELPGRLRLRAWKFGHAVFDLTLIDGEGWLLVPAEAGMEDRAEAVRQLPAGQLGEAFALLGPAYFTTASPLSGGGDSEYLTVTGRALGREDVICEIHRPTLTPRRFVLPLTGEPVASGAPAPAAELTLDRYRPLQPVVWPTTIRMRSAEGEVVIRLEDVELNGALAEGAFIPPRRAVKLP